MTIRRATAEDTQALVELTALTPMKGKISIRIDRKPDFFELLKQRGSHIVLVAEDARKRLVGSFSAASEEFVMGEERINIHYLGDLKVHPDYAGSSVAYRLVKTMESELRKADADYLVCTAAEGNEQVFPFFDGRAGIPPFKRTAIFNVYQILPKRYQSAVTDKVQQEELLNFYLNYYSRYHLRPSITHLSACDHAVLKTANEITAAISLADPGAFKQNIILDYPATVSMLLNVLRMLKPVLSMPALPKKGYELRLLYVRYLGFLENARTDFRQLVQWARNYAFEKNFHFLSIAVDEKDRELNDMIRPLSKFNFRSIQLMTSLKGNTHVMDLVGNRLNYEDYSLV